jgi:DNA-binding IclR family transcriptional regulator
MIQIDVPYSGTPGASAIDRAIDVLFELHSSGSARGVTEIARAAALPKSTTHRLLQALRGRGLAEVDDRGRYRPGVALLVLGARSLGMDPRVAAARPALERLAKQLGETAFLVGDHARRLIVLDRVEGAGIVRAAPPLGGEVPLHATAAGRLYLAFAPGAVVLPSGRLTRFEASTPSDRRTLVERVELARTRGWDVNLDEWVDGLSVVSVPIRPRGEMCAALAVATSTSRMRVLGIERVAAEASAVALDVEERLGGDAP